MLQVLPILRRLVAILPLLSLGACAQLNWNTDSSEARSDGGSQAVERDTRRQRAASRPGSQGSDIETLENAGEGLAERREQLRNSELALAPQQRGYFMDVLEARLRQAIDGTDIGMGRGDSGFFVTIPGAASFDLGSSTLMQGIRPSLAKLSDVLAEFQNTLLVINGHTDNQGDAELNRRLSERRARSVADFLKERGVASRRMVVIGQGETQPAASNETPEGRAANRRVEIVIEAIVREENPPG